MIKKIKVAKIKQIKHHNKIQRTKKINKLFNPNNNITIKKKIHYKFKPTKTLNKNQILLKIK